MVRSIACLALFASVPAAFSSSRRRRAPESEKFSLADWRQHYEKGTPFFNAQRGATEDMFASSLPQLDLDALAEDIKAAMRNNQPVHWPADHGSLYGYKGNYGPLFVRLAWHCAGTYRMSDGAGGCGGGGIRFEPLRSWDDNTNLDKARALLAPIKAKYGDALSWGDLIVAAGTIAMRDMGAPIEQFCVGRVDDNNGRPNEVLGENGAPCEPFQGGCQEPLGTGTTGLIYVNPEGPVIEEGGSSVPDPRLSAKDIRDVFGRMGQDDRATVALIGGGHAFGKCHGACNNPGAQGLSPHDAFEQNADMAWQGTCKSGPHYHYYYYGTTLEGKGPNQFTSGFEGPWTTTPTEWGNEFFRYLLDFEWERHTGPGGHQQWRIKDASGDRKYLMRLTSDIALIYDYKYLKLVKEFAYNQGALDRAFSDAWFKLTHRGSGRWSASARCDRGTIPQWVLEQRNNRMLDSDAVSESNSTHAISV